MEVRTLKEHENAYGTRDGLSYKKTSGRVYTIEDDAARQALIDDGYVELASKQRKADDK